MLVNLSLSFAAASATRSSPSEKKANAEKGIEAVKKAAADAAVVDLTDEAAKK
jgi:Domain of unknown function (DUF1508)